MSAPVYQGNNPYIYFTCDRAPTAIEADVSVIGIPTDYYTFWWDQVNKNMYQMMDGTAGALVWHLVVTPANIASVMSGATSSKLNTARSYSTRSSPAFGTSYTPSATNDTLVIASVSASNTLLTTSTINFQINPGTGLATVAPFSASGIVVGVGLVQPHTFSVIVPANSSYAITSAGSGTNTLLSIKELTL